MKNLIGALVKFQSEVTAAEKNSTNPHFKSGYANLESVLDATREALTRNGLAVVQTGKVREDGRPVLITTLMHTSGETMESELPILNEKNNAHGLGSGISYARRYAQVAILNLAQTDDDGNGASSKNVATIKQIKAAPQGSPTQAPQAKGPADYVVNFGKKLKGKRLGDIDVEEILGMVEWLNTEAKKPLTVAAREFLQMAEAYIEDQMKKEGGSDGVR